MLQSEERKLAPMIVTKPPGPNSRELLAKQSSLETRSVIYSKVFPFAIDSAKNATVKDVDGNLYIDWFSGICVLNVGHQNPAVTEAVREQMGKIWHTLEIPTDVRIRFMERINSVLPEGLKGNAKLLMSITGGDSVEAAVSIAKAVTGKGTIIAFEGAYHGVHHGVVSLTASRHYLEYSGTSRQGVYRLPYPYSYRFPFPVEKEGDESKVVLRYLEHLLEDEHSGLDDVAGILVEPIQGEGGYIVPPDDFLPGLREIATRYQIPLIMDEVQTGFGRTGHFWGCEITGTTPDIMCISKSVGQGIPLALVAYRKEYDDALGDGFHIGTYRGNPLGMAAGAAAIDYIQRENILDRVRRLGPKTQRRFQEIANSSPKVGEVRGVGFMIGNEIVKSKRTKEPAKALAEGFRKRMFEDGLLMHTCGHYGNVLRFMAPLTIEESLLDKGLRIFENTVKHTPNGMKP
jgi:4-aminobutyrate aminotransferase